MRDEEDPEADDWAWLRFGGLDLALVHDWNGRMC